MKNAWKSIFVLSLTLVCGLVLLGTSIALPAAAGDGIDCSEVSGCSGSAGCAFGAPNGCVITCSDGTSVHCNSFVIT